MYLRSLIANNNKNKVCWLTIFLYPVTFFGANILMPNANFLNTDARQVIVNN